MKLTLASANSKSCRCAFTLVELMIAMSVGLVLAGTAVMLLVQAGSEQRRGYADTTVEESAYMLQANVTSCLRGMSSGFGFTGSYTNTIVNTNGTTIAWTKIDVWRPDTNGVLFTRASISADPVAGTVTYTPNVKVPATKILWMTSGSHVVLRRLYFSKSMNFDGSQNNTLVNVTFLMDDNGSSGQNATYNVASIQRSFSVQMRCD